MTTCPGCGAPVHAGSRRCASCEASARRLIPGRPLPPPVPHRVNGDRTLVGAGGPARAAGGGSRAGAWREPAPTRPMARPYDLELDEAPDDWPVEDRRGRGLVLPVLVGTAATVLAIIGLVAVGAETPERAVPAPDVAMPTTAGPDPAATAPVPPATTATDGASTLPTVAISAMTPVAAAPPAPDTASTAPAAPVTTVVAPPATDAAAAAAAQVAAPPAAEPVEVTAAQELASALADGDWARARQLNPAVATWSDDEFEEGYGDLAASTVVPVGTSDVGGGRMDLRMGLVAHQYVEGDRRTTLYCVTWRVDPALGTVGQQGAAAVLDTRSSWIDPAEIADEVRSGC